MASAARKLKDETEVLCDFDTDLLYGFNTSVTEETLCNFKKIMHCDADSEGNAIYDLLLHPYDEKILESTARVVYAWRKETKDARTCWRLSAQRELSESDVEHRQRQNDLINGNAEPRTLHKTFKNIEKRFDDCVCDDCPRLAFEYERRVRDLQAGIEAPAYIGYNTETNKYTRKATDEDMLEKEWLYQQSPSALVDSGLMIEFYAEMERRDLVQNMHTCSYFSADASYMPEIPLEDAGDTVNPWTWMFAWLEGHIDGVRWADLGREGGGDKELTVEEEKEKEKKYQANMHILYTRRNRGKGRRDEQARLVIGAHVRAIYRNTSHFMPGIITKVADNGEDAHVLFTCDKNAAKTFRDEDLAQAHVVSRKYMIAIEDPQLINSCLTDDGAVSETDAALDGPAPSWFTHHMTGIFEDVHVQPARFKCINTNVSGIEILGMLMMDAFREEVYRQCRLRVEMQLDALKTWSDFNTSHSSPDPAAEPVKEMVLGRPGGDRSPSIDAFVQAQYPWSIHKELRDAAVEDIERRLQRANARVDKLLPQKDRRGGDVPTSGDLYQFGVFELIDDVISTRMGYAQAAKKKQGGDGSDKSSPFPFDWGEIVDGRRMITTDLEMSIAKKEPPPFELKALRVAAVGDAKSCEKVSVTAMSKFERVAEVGRDLVLKDPPAIWFDGVCRFTKSGPFSFDKSGNHPRVAHGDYTYRVTYEDGGVAIGLPASMLALVDNADAHTGDRWTQARLSGVLVNIITYVELQVDEELATPAENAFHIKFEAMSDDDAKSLEIMDILDSIVKKQKILENAWWLDIYVKIGSEDEKVKDAECARVVELMQEALDAEEAVLAKFSSYLASTECPLATKTELFDQTKWKLQYSTMAEDTVLRSALNFILNLGKKSWKEELDEIQDQNILEAHVQNLIEELHQDKRAAETKKPAEEDERSRAEKARKEKAKKEKADKEKAKKEAAAAAATLAAAADALAAAADPKKAAAALAAAADALAAAADPKPPPRVHKLKGDEPPDEGGARTEADFFTHCEEWIADNPYKSVLMAKLKPFGIWQDKIPTDQTIPVYMAELIHIGVKFAEHFGRAIPTMRDSTAAIRPSLEADVRTWIDRKHNFESVYKIYRYNQKVTREEHCYNMHEVAWLLGLFPKTPALVDKAMAVGPAALLAEYRQTITYAQCAWLCEDLVGFCANGALRTSALMVGGTHRLQDSVLDVLHRSADDHNYAELTGAKFALAEAVWLSLHVHSEDGEATSDELQGKVAAHCRSAYGRLTDEDEKKAFQGRISTCKTPGQLLRGERAEVEMPIEAYPYHLRPLFPRRTPTGYVTSRALLTASEVTDPSQLKPATPSPYAAFLRLQDKVFCGLSGATHAKEEYLPVLYPTRRPWTCSDGLAIRQAHMTAFADKWPDHWHRLRDEVSLRVSLRVPYCVSSMHYMRGHGITPKKHEKADVPTALGMWPQRTFTIRFPAAKVRYDKIGRLSNKSGNCWLNSLCQFMFRSRMGPVIMAQMRNCMQLFRTTLGDVPASMRPQIMELARKCIRLTTHKRKYSNSQTLRSWSTWVLYLSGKKNPLSDSPEKLVNDLVEDNLFLTYVAAELLYDIYRHVHTGETPRDVVELQHVMSYIRTPSRLNTQMFSPSTQQQDAQEAISILIQIMIFFVKTSDELVAEKWVPGHLRAFMRDTPIDIFASLQNTFTAVTICQICKNEFQGPPETSCILPVGFGDEVTIPTKFSKILTDSWSVSEDLIEKGKYTYNCEKCNPKDTKKKTAATRQIRYKYNDFAVFHLRSEKRFVDPSLVGLEFDESGKDLYIGEMRKDKRCLNLIVDEDLELNGRAYSLVGTLRHWGDLRGGHWTAFVKNKGDWWHCNDAAITKVQFAEAVDQKLDRTAKYTLVLLLYEANKSKKEEKKVEREEEGSGEEDGEEEKKKEEREKMEAKKREEEQMKKETKKRREAKKREDEEEERKKETKKRMEAKKREHDEEEKKKRKELKRISVLEKKAAERDDLEAMLKRLEKKRAERDKATATPTSRDGKVKYKHECNGIDIEVVFGEITDVHADAVVNAANGNSFTTGDHGISGRLRDLMYPRGIKKGQSEEEDEKVITTMKNVYSGEKNVPRKTVGETKAGVQVAAGQLLENYKYVIHAVGPKWNDEEHTKLSFSTGKGKLDRTIRNVFHAADGLNIKSIVLCIISGGIFCHDAKLFPKVNAEEKTAARQVLVDSIYVHCMQSDRSKTPRLEKIAVFEYDNKTPEASRLLKETIDMLTQKLGASAAVEGGEADAEDDGKGGDVDAEEDEEADAEDDGKGGDVDAEEDEEADAEDDGKGGDVDAEEDDEEGGGKGGDGDAEEDGEMDVDEEETIDEKIEKELEVADGDDETTDEDGDDKGKSDEEGDGETLVYDRMAAEERTAFDSTQRKPKVFMPWDDLEKFQVDLDHLPTTRGTLEEQNVSIIRWTQKYHILDTFYQGQTDKQKLKFIQTMTRLVKDVKNIPDSRKRLMQSLVEHHFRGSEETKLSSATVRTLLACAFVGLLRHGGGNVNFWMILTKEKTADNHDMRSLEKLRCVWSYFEQAYGSEEMKTPRMLSFKCVYTKFNIDLWRNSEKVVGGAHVHNLNSQKSKIAIHDMCDMLDGACWEVDFANPYPGGGILGKGALQEEIRFAQCPELIVCRLLIKRMGDEQAVHATGFRQFNDTSGYSSNHEPKFKFDKKHGKSEEPANPRKMILMDATRYSHTESDEQFTMASINRELQKAYVGFSTGDDDPIATGHWGAGDFKGDKQLKALIQVLAAGQAEKQLEYCVWGDSEKEVKAVVDGIAEGTTVGQLYSALEKNLTAKNTWTAFEKMKVGYRDTQWFKDTANRLEFFRRLCPAEKEVEEAEVEETKKKTPAKKTPAKKTPEKKKSEVEKDGDVTKKKKKPCDDTWFRNRFGFYEKLNGKTLQKQFELNRGRFHMEANNLLCWKDDIGDDQSIDIGHFSVDSVGELMDSYNTLKYNEKDSGEYDPESDRLIFNHILPTGGVQGLISNPENDAAVFMVASQFNALEMLNEFKSPAGGVTMYAEDRTQGPACAMACPGALIYRNYLLNPKPRDKDCEERGQHKYQLNLMELVEEELGNDDNLYWNMKNGYLKPIGKKNYLAMEKVVSSLDDKGKAALRDKVEVAVHWDTAVADETHTHRVTQVLCSAVGVGYFNKEISMAVPGHHELAKVVLRAAFYGTLAVAAIRADELGAEVSVYLTAIGSGAFKNPIEWVSEALDEALSEFRRAPLRVYLVHYGSIAEEWTRFAVGTFAERRAITLRDDVDKRNKKEIIAGSGVFEQETTCVLCKTKGTGHVKLKRSKPRVAVCKKCMGVEDDDTESDEFESAAASPILSG
jgi:O-acetyl-ADP-ribose deacetylase (regulator of RNase III)